jgi:hypothetical protein
MTGPWKAWKSRSSFSTLSTVSWKSRQHREIPTFPQPGFAPDGKVENQRQVSHFPTGGSRHRFLFALYSNLKLKKASRPLRGLPSLVFQDHLVLETEHDFRIILGLENARGGTGLKPTIAEGRQPNNSQQESSAIANHGY